MASYTVHMPINGALEARLDRAIFVRDGFSFGAFSLGAFWFLNKGHWLIALLLWLSYGIFVFALVRFGLVPLILPITFLLAILLGLEAASLQRLGLSWRKYEEVALLSGEGGDTLEQRFFSTYLADNQASHAALKSAAPSLYAPPSAAQNSASGSVLGLFPQPHRGFTA